jgi:hypothetical protein
MEAKERKPVIFATIHNDSVVVREGNTPNLYRLSSYKGVPYLLSPYYC